MTVDPSSSLARKIDIEPARKFIRALRGCRMDEPDPSVVFQTVDDHKSKPGSPEQIRYTNVFTGTIKDCAPGLVALNLERAGIFIKINAGGRKKAETTHPLALFVDFDAKDQRTEKYDPLKPTPSFAELRPSALIATSPESHPNKVHAYWWLKDGASITWEQWERAMKHLALVFDGDRGVATRERTMRLPGFYHNKPGKDPERSVLLDLHPRPRYSLEEILRAFPIPPHKRHIDIETNKPRTDTALRTTPTNGVHTADSKPKAKDDSNAFTIELNKGIEASDGSEKPKKKRTKFDERAEHTNHSLYTFHGLIDWLDRRHIKYITSPAKPRIIKLDNCPFNSEHKDFILETHDSGAIGARCFHESCLSNTQIWSKVRDRIGGWAHLRRGDQAEVAAKLLEDVRAQIPEPVVSDAGILYRYEYSTGVWETIPDYQLEKRVMKYAGMKVGETRLRPLRMSHRDMRGIVQFAHVEANRPGFFDDVPLGCAFANGFVAFDPDKRELKLVPHSATYRLRHAYKFDFADGDYKALAPRWLQFLDEVFTPDEDKAHKIELLQEFIGACLFGLAPRYAAAMFMTGEGSNGKSVVIKVIKALFPTSAMAAITPHALKNEYHRAHLVGILLNAVSEVPERELMDAASFKAIVDGSPITARHPYGRSFTFQPQAGHLFACNRLPPSGDDTLGFWRRVLVLSFNRSFKIGVDADLDLESKLLTELNGIARWAIEGTRRLVANRGFTRLASVDAAKRSWALHSNPLLAWIEEDCEPVDIAHGRTTEQLYDSYVVWCRGANHPPLSRLSFSQRLAHAGITNIRIQKYGTKETKRWAIVAPEAAGIIFN